MRPEFISEHDLHPSELRAGVSDGTLEPWRRDATGVMFFKKTSHAIHAVPPTGEVTQAVQLDDEFDIDSYSDEFEDDDAE